MRSLERVIAALPLLVVLATGDTRVLGPGRHLGPIHVAPDCVLEASAPNVIVVGPGPGPAVILAAGATLRGIGVRGADGSPLGAAVRVHGADARIERCEIRGGPGDGVLVLRGSVTLAGCTVTASRA